MTPTTDNDDKQAVIKGFTLLLLTSALWGSAFVFQKNATQHLDAFSFNFLRFAIAIVTLLCLRLLPRHLFRPDEKDIPQQRRLRHSAWFIGVGSGVLMFLGITLQQLGLSYTTAGKSGFLTALYIILVPILALFVGQRCRMEVWVGTLLTFLGVFFLGSGGVVDDLESQFNTGDILTLICALAWAAQVLWLGIFARYADVLTVATLQVAVVSLLSAATMGFFWLTQEGGGYALPTLENIWAAKIDLLYTGVISAGVAFTLQILGQRYVSATNAALLMSFEAVFALVTGVIFLGEQVTLVALLGCLCIFAGIILAQLQGKVFPNLLKARG
ncbi:MAG: EamA family transporter [Gammaproteobacteria bacterium]|nr:MAG: EamA family transporter [Gammaproteobacteria bacterium]